MLGSQKPSSVKAQQPQKRCNQERQYLIGKTFVGNNFRRYYFLSVIIFITWRKVRDILPTKNYCRRKILPFLEFCEWHIKLNSTILPQHPPTWSLDRKDRLNINIIKLSCLLKKFPQFLPIPKFLIVTIPMNFFNYSLVVLIVLTRILNFHIPY